MRLSAKREWTREIFGFWLVLSVDRILKINRFNLFYLVTFLLRREFSSPWSTVLFLSKKGCEDCPWTVIIPLLLLSAYKLSSKTGTFKKHAWYWDPCPPFWYSSLSEGGLMPSVPYRHQASSQKGAFSDTIRYHDSRSVTQELKFFSLNKFALQKRYNGISCRRV